MLQKKVKNLSSRFDILVDLQFNSGLHTYLPTKFLFTIFIFSKLEFSEFMHIIYFEKCFILYVDDDELEVPTAMDRPNCLPISKNDSIDEASLPKKPLETDSILKEGKFK